MNYGGPGSYLTTGNRYSSLMGGQQQQQQQNDPFGNLSISDAKSGYDTYAQFAGKPSSNSSLMDMLGMGGGAGAGGFYASSYPTASAAWGAGDFAAFSPYASGAVGGGAGGAAGGGAGGAAGASSLMGFAGPLGVLGLAAYLGYQQGEKQRAEWDEEERAPARQESIAFLDANPGALTNEGIPGDQRPQTAPYDGMANFRYNPATGRFEDMDTGETWYDANERGKASQGSWFGD